MKVVPQHVAEPTTRLGDWYANLVHVGRLQLVLCVSERTLLPVLVPAAPISSLASRLCIALGEVLRALGVSREEIVSPPASEGPISSGITGTQGPTR